MDFTEKNDFIVANSSAKHFDADFKLYRKTFPQSPLIKSLELAEDYNKQSLDERILNELLDSVPPNAVLSNRADGPQAKAKAAPAAPAPAPEKPAQAKPEAAKPVADKKTPKKKARGRAKNIPK